MWYYISETWDKEVIVVLYRKVYNKIKSWYNSSYKKSLLIEGARQIGKTYIIRKFLEENTKSFVEFNLFENDLAKHAFESATNAKELLLRISALSDKKLIKGETVIFIDEVQAADEIITKIKFLIEDGSYKYILSGSLLGITYKNVNSLPVGYMDVYEMRPLDFEEFAIANGVSADTLNYLKECFENKIKVDDIIHKQMTQLFNLYTIIGGFPEAVSAFLKTNNLQNVHLVHETIDKLYKLDVSKYVKEEGLIIKDIYNLIPSELNSPNKRFIIKNLKEKTNLYRYEESLVWLLNSNIGLFTYNVDNPVYPLLASKNRRLFKLYLCDTGLLSYYLFDDNGIRVLSGDINVNYGATYENVVAQELKAHNFSLYYYNGKKRGEVDFLIEKEGKIIPIEVKSGKDYKRHVALNNLLNAKEFKIDKAYTLCNSNLEIDDKRVYLPIYMIMFLSNEKRKIDLKIDLDLSALK